jgi:hypothetical protein
MIKSSRSQESGVVGVSFTNGMLYFFLIFIYGIHLFQ